MKTPTHADLLARYDVEYAEPVYPTKFVDAEMDVPDEPNVIFQFVVKAPKEYVFDTWHLSYTHGGVWRALKGTGCRAAKMGEWATCSNDVHRVDTRAAVVEIIGNVRHPKEGDWHFEWKTGEAAC